MPLRSEWIAGVTASGRRLPAAKVTAYRAAAGLDPLPMAVSQAAKPEPRTPSPCRRGKPGNELMELLKSLGIPARWCEGCKGRAAMMNQNGIVWCRENRATIVGWLAEQRDSVDWITQASVAAKMLTTGVYLLVNPLDPLGSLVDIAIMRAEKCESGTCGA